MLGLDPRQGVLIKPTMREKNLLWKANISEKKSIWRQELKTKTCFSVAFLFSYNPIIRKENLKNDLFTS